MRGAASVKEYLVDQCERTLLTCAPEREALHAAALSTPELSPSQFTPPEAAEPEQELFGRSVEYRGTGCNALPLHHG